MAAGAASAHTVPMDTAEPAETSGPLDSGHSARRGGVLTALVFTGAVVVTGGNAVAIRVSNRELDPLFGAAARFAAAALVFVVIMALSGKAWPRGRQLAGALLYGLLNFGLAYGFIYEGLRTVHAGLAQIILASVPLATILLAAAFGLEVFSWRRVLGTVVALGGIAVVSGIGTGGAPQFSIPGVVAITAAAVSVGAGAVVVKRFPPLPIAALNAIGMAVGAGLLAIASVASGERWAVPAAPSTWVALGFLVVSTVAIFAAFLFVLRRWSASATSYQFLLIPIPAVVLSALIDAEPLTPGLAVGGLLVLAGSWAGMRPGKGRSTGRQTKSATMISTSSRRMSRSRSSSRT